MKDLVFNELTETPVASDLSVAISRVEQFLQTYKAKPEGLFNRGIRLDKHIGQIELTEEYTIQNLASMDGRARTLASTLLSLGRFPYLEEGSQEEEQYISNRYFIQKNGRQVDVIGLAAAYLQNTIAIGFESEIFWQNHTYSLVVEYSVLSTTETDVFSVSSPEHFSSGRLLQWIDDHTDIQLVESELDPGEKQIHLREDHGIDILRSFAQRLVRSRLVVGIVNSCEFSPHNRRFVRSINDNGIIEITLFWTDQGLGMAIQTTGRNYRETQKIAELLQERFSK